MLYQNCNEIGALLSEIGGHERTGRYIFIYIDIEESRPPLWSSQSSWLQIQRSGFNSWRYQIFWEVVGLERGPLSLASTIEDLLGRKNSGSGLENRDYGRRDQKRWTRDALYSQKLTLASPTSGGRSVGIVRLRTKATELFRPHRNIVWRHSSQPNAS
jgi:hypothetical protein